MSSHSLKRLARMIVQIDCCPDSDDLHSFICWLVFFLWQNFSIISGAMIGFTIIIKMSFYIIYHNGVEKIIYYTWWCPTLLQSNDLIWFHPPVTHGGPGMENNPDLAFVKKVLAVAPKVAAMVNLFLKLPRKLIGLKRRKKEVLVVKHFITYCILFLK